MPGLYTNYRQGLYKINSLLPLYGVWGTIKIVIKNIVWVERMYRLEKDLSGSEEQVTPKIPLRVIYYSNDDLDLTMWKGREQILHIRGEYGILQFKKRFRRGDKIFVAYCGDDIVGFVWLEFPPGEDVGYLLSLDEAYTFDAWTFEAYRGNRALPVIQQEISKYLIQNHSNLRRIVTHIAVWNEPSLSGYRRAGYRITRLEASVSLMGFHRKFKLRQIV